MVGSVRSHTCRRDAVSAAPATDIRPRLSSRTRDVLGRRGSYLVNAAGGCNDCHTWPNYAPGHDPFLAQPKQENVTHYLAGGRDFGPFLSRNLTRVPETHSVDDFIRTMR